MPLRGPNEAGILDWGCSEPWPHGVNGVDDLQLGVLHFRQVRIACPGMVMTDIPVASLKSFSVGVVCLTFGVGETGVAGHDELRARHIGALGANNGYLMPQLDELDG